MLIELKRREGTPIYLEANRVMSVSRDAEGGSYVQVFTGTGSYTEYVGELPLEVAKKVNIAILVDPRNMAVGVSHESIQADTSCIPGFFMGAVVGAVMASS